MFTDEQDAVEFRDRIVATIAPLDPAPEAWRVSPTLDGVDLHVTDHAGAVRGRLDGRGYRVLDRGTSEDGDWTILEVRPA